MKPDDASAEDGRRKVIHALGNVVARPNIAGFGDVTDDKVERLHGHHRHDVLILFLL